MLRINGYKSSSLTINKDKIFLCLTNDGQRIYVYNLIKLHCNHLFVVMSIYIVNYNTTFGCAKLISEIITNINVTK